MRRTAVIRPLESARIAPFCSQSSLFQLFNEEWIEPTLLRRELMTTVNPVQTTTFGTGTGIDVSSGSGIGVSGSNAQNWAVTNKGAISGGLYGVNLAGGRS